MSSAASSAAHRAIAAVVTAALAQCALLLAACNDAPPEAAPTERKARSAARPLDVDLWVWQGRVVHDASERERFFRVVDRLGCRAVYVSLDRRERARLLTPANPILTAFLAACKRREIDVQLLLSENTWVFPEKRAVLFKAIARLNAFQDAARDGGFAALHLDVEPHVLPGWKDGTRKPALARGLVELVRAVRERTALPVHVDVPTWYEKIPCGEADLFHALLDAASGAAIMNYRTSLDGFVRGAETELAAAAKTGRTVVVGVSVERNQSEKIAFHRWEHLARTVQAARNRWREAGSGTVPRIAIQSYRHVKRALEIE